MLYGMSARTDSPAEHGIGTSLNWLIGGAVSGVVGSAAFGVLLWAIDPDIVTAGVPAIYGLDPASVVGWAFHLFHGLVLGIVFGFVVTRKPVLGTITADVETGFIASMGPGARLTLAGLVYGLAVWSILPLIVLPIWTTVGRIDAPAFPATPVESLVGHVIYGSLVGGLFSVFVEVAPEAEETEAPFEEASEPPEE